MKACFIIPAFNEAKCIRRTIYSARAAGMPVYVVDDGSSDGTAAMAEHAGAAVLRIENRGKAGALLAGIRHFELWDRYEWVGILDADSRIDADYITAMDRAAEQFPEAVILCGAPKSAPANWLTAFRAVEYAMSLGIYREAQHLLGTINVAPGCASLYKSEVMRTLEFTSDTLVEDMDLTIQVQRRGLRVAYVPEAHVITQDPRTLRGYIGQIARWYRGTWQVVRKHRVGRRAQLIDLEIVSLLADGLAFALLLAALPAIFWWKPWVVALGLGFDQLLLLTFTLLTARRERRWDVLASFPLFTIPRLASAGVFAWAFLTTRRPSGVGSWYHVARY